MAELVDDVLTSLDSEQRAGATTVRGPVCVIAGAGTGKTRAITHRLAYAAGIGVVDPQRILALTFTARAAGEMRSRLRALGFANITARTFHAAALKQLMYFWPQALGGRFPSLLTTKTGFIGEALNRAGIPVSKRAAILRDVAGEIEWSKVIGIAPDEYVRSAEDYARTIRTSNAKVESRDIARIYEAYESLKRQERAIDFEDVLLLTVGMLEEERDIRDRVRDQYRYFTVDEYQDVSPLQQRLLDLWLGKRDDICVVGDPAQTIYSFAGATPAFLLNFTNRYPNAEVIRLSTAYRSTPEIVNMANTILRKSDLGHALDPINDHGEKPTINGYLSEKEEIRSITESIETQISAGVDPSTIAILARTNAQLESFETALTSSGIENQIRSSERFFNRPDVREMVAALRSASVLSEGDWVSDLRDALKQFAELPHARAITRLAGELANEGFTTLRAFVRELEERAEQNNPPSLPGITLATLHSAKGLEWDQVYLAGASDGVLPWGTESEAEERRLFYVGLTRARNELRISYSGRPSAFLEELR